MIFLCNDCQLIFQDRVPNCPACGGRVVRSEDSVEVLLQEGFTLAKRSRIQPPPLNPIGAQPSIDDEDILASLRRDYNQQHQRPGHSIPDQPKTQTPPVAPGNMPDQGDDFFAAFQPIRNPLDRIPTVQPASLPVSDIPYPLEENQHLRRDIRREQYRLASLNFLSGIRWRTVFRILLIAAVAAALWSLWRMRYVILNSIWNFILSILPLILVIWFLVYVTRSIFKR